MKKYLMMCLLPVFFIISGFLFTNNASAYFKDNCYAIQYEKNVNVKGDFNKKEVYSTKQLCMSGGSLETREIPNADRTLPIGDGATSIRKVPSFAISGDSVTLKYCNGGHMICVGGTQEKVFKLSDYNGNFESMAQAIDSFVSGIGNPSGCTKLAMNVNDATSGTTSNNDTGDDDGDDGSDSAGDPCYNAGLNSQSWIGCPTMRNLEYTAGTMDNIIEGWLSVDTSLYNTSSPTAIVWETMRNIANVIMVIILLVIIFSQLTGVGIDNYGIKKMLPRLIAVAILINLSLVICELAIDLSNLLGTGLRNLFGAIGQNILEGRGVTDYMENFVSLMVTVLMAAAGVSGVVAPLGLTVVPLIGASDTGMIIIVLILTLLIVVAAIIVFFVMLGARMIIIIGCVALAPIALALYILPNTQDLYKKWFTAFKTALVVFPICGAVSGISYIIKAIVLTSDEIHIWMGVIGIIAPFLVFFMLPSMLRGVLGTLGKVGEALNSLGQNVRSGARTASSAIQSSDAFKERMAYDRKKFTYNRAGNTMSRISGKMKSGENISARERSQFARAAAIQSSFDNERVSDVEALLNSGKYQDVDVNDMDSMKKYHSDKLAEYHNETDKTRKAAIMDEIKAAQNIMSKSSGGRDAVAENIENAAKGGITGALSDASSHLLANHGETYKQKNRAAHTMFNDLATNNPEAVNKINSGEYVNKSVDKYTEETLTGADDGAIENLITNMNNGSMSVEQANQLKATAESIARKAETGNLHVKP